jgi:hypothetical protein
MIPSPLPYYAHLVDYTQDCWIVNQKFEKIGGGAIKNLKKLVGGPPANFSRAEWGDRPQCSMACVQCSDRLCAVQREAMI